MSKQLLKVGQRVWLELISLYYTDKNDERKVYEYEIVTANDSSAYAVSVKSLERYNEDTKANSYLKKRIEQRTLNIVSKGYGDDYKLWLTKEEFDNDVQYTEELIALRKKANAFINTMPLSDLKNFIVQFEGKTSV